jgi:hypothetical protein
MCAFSTHWQALPLALLASIWMSCSQGGASPGSGGSGADGGKNSGGGMSGAASGGSAGASTSGVGGVAAGTSGAGGVGGSGGDTAGTAGGGGTAAATCFVPSGTDDPPMMLSQTGCIDMADPTKPAPGLVPYSVRSPLWSDAAAKERFVRIPEGKKIHVLDCAVDVDACKDPGDGGSGEDEGHFDMPIGTVLVKNFSIEGKHIETRLLMRRSQLSWSGFSYEWNDAQTDATLLPDDDTGKDKPVGSAQQVWHYPSRTECFKCHTKYAGSSLGPSTAQLNSDFAYADGSMNQIEKFKQLGLFDAPPKNIDGYPVPTDTTATVEQRARSYIQSNCAMCHRPGAEFGSIDMRFTTSLGMSKMCDMIERDMPDLAPLVYRLVPGAPAQSVMSTRMHTLGKLRMPQIGTKVVDEAGSKLVDDWIASLSKSACPDQP